MSDNVWVSARHPDGRTFTVGGADYAALVANLMDLYEGNQEKVNKVLDGFDILSDPPAPAQPAGGASSAPSSGGGAPPPGAPSCEHGVRTWKEAFQARSGKAMPSSWQCPSRDRNNQCKAIWNDS